MRFPLSPPFARDNTLDVVLRPHPDGTFDIHPYGMVDEKLMCSGIEALPDYIKYALTCRVSYRFPVSGMPGDHGCVMSIPRHEAEALFRYG